MRRSVIGAAWAAAYSPAGWRATNPPSPRASRVHREPATERALVS
jgi:hypothetical protein